MSTVKRVVLVLIALVLLLVMGFFSEQKTDIEYQKAMDTYEIELVEAAQLQPELVMELGRRNRWRWNDDRDNGDNISPTPRPEPRRWRILPKRPIQERLYYRLYHLAGSGLCIVGVLWLGSVVVKGWFK